jgi:hypothetical protein
MTTFRNENARLARARTLEWIAESRLAALPDGPVKREQAAKLRAVQAKLRQQEQEARQ